MRAIFCIIFLIVIGMLCEAKGRELYWLICMVGAMVIAALADTKGST